MALIKMSNIKFSTSQCMKKQKLSEQHILTSIKNLPEEVILKIFSYLPLRDIKAARTVNWKWYAIANSRKFRRKERIICNGIYSTENIIQLLISSHNSFMNIEFIKVSFNESHREFFQVMGSQIICLHFVDCIVHETIWREIVVSCNNLEKLSLAFYHTKPVQKTRSLFSVFENEDALPIHQKLNTATLYFCTSHWISNVSFQHFSNIFPNISAMSVTCKSLDAAYSNGYLAAPPNEITFSDYVSHETFTFSSIFHWIQNKSNSIKKLSLDVGVRANSKYNSQAMDIIAKFTNFSSLRHLDVTIDTKMTKIEFLLSFLKRQTELKSIYLEFNRASVNDLELILDAVLNNCPKLRDLGFTYKNDFHISLDVFCKLFYSKLRSLDLNIEKLIINDAAHTEKIIFSSNTSLKNLKIKQMPAKYLRVFIEFCQRLNVLEIFAPEDYVLIHIWKYQTNLKYLSLGNVSYCSCRGFPTGNSFNRLQKLEGLKIMTQDDVWEIEPDVFSNFELPNLKCINASLEITNDSANTKFLEMLEKCSKLEYAYLDLPCLMETGWKQSIGKWKLLRYIEIVDGKCGRLNEATYVKYFTICKKLRALNHNFTYGKESYYYDIFAKCVKRKTEKVVYRIASEKIGGVFIDWTSF